jgi:hypothetical protein
VSRDEDDLAEEHIRVVRTGHGANCSSIGSVIDTLFATATVGAAVFAAVLGALKKESITIVGAARPAAPPAAPPPPEPS